MMPKLFEQPNISRQHLVVFAILITSCVLISMHDLAGAQTPDWKSYSSSEGEISVEHAVYFLENNHDSIIVNVKGRSYHYSSNSDDKLELWIKPPYITENVEFKKVTPAITGKGFFDYPLQLRHGPTQDERIPEGIYELNIRYTGTQIGPLTFEIRYDYSNPAPRKPSTVTPPPLFIPSNLPKITIETDSQSYTVGEVVKISGTVNYFDPDKSQSGLTLTITDPKDNRVGIAQVNPDPDGTFSYTYKIGGVSKHDGQYVVLANYEKEEFSTTFDVNFLIAPPPPPPLKIHKRAFIEMWGFGNTFDFDLSKFQNKDPDIRFENSYGKTIHIYKDRKTIQDLFDSLNIGITAQCLTEINSGRDFCSDLMHELKFSVNGRDTSTLSNHILEDGDLIKIEYEKLPTNPAPVPTPAPMPSPTPQQPSFWFLGSNQPIVLIWIVIMLVLTGIVIVIAENRIKKKTKKQNPDKM